MRGIHKAAFSTATSGAEGDEGGESWRPTCIETEREERDGVREGRRNLTYFSLAYLYAEDNMVNQPEAWKLA